MLFASFQRPEIFVADDGLVMILGKVHVLFAVIRMPVESGISVGLLKRQSPVYFSFLRMPLTVVAFQCPPFS